jgi:hypothetical protein
MVRWRQGSPPSWQTYWRTFVAYSFSGASMEPWIWRFLQTAALAAMATWCSVELIAHAIRPASAASRLGQQIRTRTSRQPAIDRVLRIGCWFRWACAILILIGAAEVSIVWVCAILTAYSANEARPELNLAIGSLALSSLVGFSFLAPALERAVQVLREGGLAPDAGAASTPSGDSSGQTLASLHPTQGKSGADVEETGPPSAEETR